MRDDNPLSNTPNTFYDIILIIGGLKFSLEGDFPKFFMSGGFKAELALIYPCF